MHNSEIPLFNGKECEKFCGRIYLALEKKWYKDGKIVRECTISGLKLWS